MNPPYPSEITALEPPLPLGISNDLPWGGGGVCIFSGTTHCCCDSSTIFVLLVAIFQLSYVAVSRPFACWNFTLTWPLLITGFNFSSWNTLVIDGHDVEAVCKAFYEAKTTKGRPTAILAKTYKGKGVEGMVISHMH